jgi:RNA polymerase sigma-70 factor (ECF subfamily)
MFTPLLRYLRLVTGAAGPTDGALLQRYLEDGSDTAFAALVERHAGMVRGVCRRVLGNCHDADDASQAAFLVLMRRAATIARRDSVASWLHGVAYRTALKARAAAGRRRILERQACRRDVTDDVPAAVWRELRPILDEEIDRLPDKYRLPFVLCYLEGKTNVEAAEQLQWPAGTVATRLAWARQRLRQRLTRRGAGLAAGLLVALAAPLARATSKPAWQGTSSEQATVLAKGVLQTMYLTKVRTAAGVLLMAGLLVAGAAAWLYRAAAAETTSAPVPVVGPARASAAMPKDKAAGTAKGDAAAGRSKQFVIACKVVEIDVDGGETVLSQPKIITLDGRPAHLLVGQSFPVPGQKEASIDYLDVGVVEMEMVVVARKDGRLHVDIKVQINEPLDQEKDSFLVGGQHAHCVKIVNPNAPIQFEFAKGDGTRYRAAFTVTEFEQTVP